MDKIFKANSYNAEADICFLNGDVFKKIKTIPNESISLIISSPPYNINKEYAYISAPCLYNIFRNTKKGIII